MAENENGKKERNARVKSPMEAELHAAKRVAAAVEGLSLASRGRVLDLVVQHNAEERDRAFQAECNVRNEKEQAEKAAFYRLERARVESKQAVESNGLTGLLARD